MTDELIDVVDEMEMPKIETRGRKPKELPMELILSRRKNGESLKSIAKDYAMSSANLIYRINRHEIKQRQTG